MKRSLLALVAGILISPCLQSAPGWACQSIQGIRECVAAPEQRLAQTAQNAETVSPLDTGTEIPAESSDASFSRDPSGPPSAWDICPPPPRRQIRPPGGAGKAEEPAQLSGIRVERDRERTYTVTGSAVLERGSERIRADQLEYRQAGSVVQAQGSLVYDNPTQRIEAKRGTFLVDEDRGELENIEYALYDKHVRGRADRAYLDKPGLTHYDDATYTTCPDGSKAWKLKAEKVVLDQNQGIGTAHSARLLIHGVPMLYTPFISFAIDDRRKTGFLVPSFGQSDNSGFDLRIPYYINIAPNYDATFTPRYLQDRGLQLNAEFRYLRNRSNGQFNLEFLPRDNISDQRRNRLIIRDTSYFGKHLSTQINYDRVSDKTYLEDMGDSLSLASVTFLQRSARADYATSWWNVGAQIDDYQLLDTTLPPDSRPYQRLPRLTLTASPPVSPYGIRLHFDSELVNFRQDTRITGKRIDAWPRLSLPLRRTAYEITPSISYRLTQYDLNNQSAGIPGTITRALPVISLDNQVYFERNFTLGNTGFTHTLEPRVFYLYVGGRDQQDIPLFDTSEPTFSYRELFVENRFSGADRMGDANQVALSVTSRLIDNNSGEERLRASVGQLFYFQNRTVTLNNTSALDERTSDIAGELDLALSRNWSARADVILNARDTAAERANVRFQYHPGYRKLANIAYRYTRSEQNQIDTSVLWPLGKHWHFVGRWYYDIGATKTLEKLAGIEYESCCWGVQLVARNFIDNINKDNNTAILVQVVLKGLTRIGSNIESVLEDGILGYTSSPEE